MSVLVIGKFKGDTAKFQQALADRADEFAKISEASKTVGGLHHRFGWSIRRARTTNSAVDFDTASAMSVHGSSSRSATF